MALKPKQRSEMDMADSSGKPQSDDNGVKFQEEELEVDIMECANPSDDEFQEKEQVLCQPSSSSSSSFGDLMCASDEDFGFGFGNGDEAQSMLSKDYPLPETCAGTAFLDMNKKKIKGPVWKRLKQPITWRCKWLELKVKEIQSQARVCEREVRNYYLTKQFDLEKAKLEGFQGKSIPFRDNTRKMETFKRRRRRRVEETTDVAAYMSNHNIFAYTDKRMPANNKARDFDPDFGGRKARGKEDGIEDDCLAAEFDCSDDFLAKLLCKIDETQGKARSLRTRVDQLTMESQTGHKSSMPQIIGPFHRDITIQNGKQCALVEEPLTRNQREATVQTGRQCITNDLWKPQTPPIQVGGQCLSNNSPVSSGNLRLHPIIEDLFMDEPEMNDDEMETDEEKLDYFRKLINEITGVPPEEADAKKDPTPDTKRRKTAK
ncbi:hypothetical protein V5N11_031103 [Cardamine amara subsp. amara]|uniref:Uncharacterized protein n=1 Tax=Cardamine amara subsp. amara TaxID=228776 RepID=A0ABD0ZK39_CARAN